MCKHSTHGSLSRARLLSLARAHTHQQSSQRRCVNTLNSRRKGRGGRGRRGSSEGDMMPEGKLLPSWVTIISCVSVLPCFQAIPGHLRDVAGSTVVRVVDGQPPLWCKRMGEEAPQRHTVETDRKESVPNESFAACQRTSTCRKRMARCCEWELFASRNACDNRAYRS